MDGGRDQRLLSYLLSAVLLMSKHSTYTYVHILVQFLLGLFVRSHQTPLLLEFKSFEKKSCQTQKIAIRTLCKNYAVSMDLLIRTVGKHPIQKTLLDYVHL